MELHILSDRRLLSTREWQSAIDAQGFALQLDRDVQLASVNGFLPALLDNEATGFECFNDDATRAIEFLGKAHFDHHWQFALGLRWLGGNPVELRSAWMAGIAYAGATGGIIFDHEEGRVFTPDQARVVVERFAHDFAALDAIIEKVKERFSKKK